MSMKVVPIFGDFRRFPLQVVNPDESLAGHQLGGVGRRLGVAPLEHFGVHVDVRDQLLNGEVSIVVTWSKLYVKFDK
jgi:hypothetical protein